jgi:YaiO family outer membrane protein
MSLLRAAALSLVLSICAAAAAGDQFSVGLTLKKAGKLAAAEAAFKQAVAEDAKNLDALEQLATVQGWLKKYHQSILTWERGLELAPLNASFRVGLARVLYWNGDYSKALHQFSQVQNRDGEVLVLEGDILSAAGRVIEAREAYTLALALAPQDKALADKLARTQKPLLWRLDSGMVAEYFSRLRSTEYDVYTQLGYTFSKKASGWIRYDYQRQFELIDRTYLFGAAYRAAPRLMILADYSATPKNQIRSRYQVNAGAEIPLPYLTPLFNYRRLSYADGTIDTYTPGFRLQLVPWLNNEFRYGISTNLNATTTYSYQIRANFFIGESLAPYLAFAHGKEAIPPLSAAISDYYSAGVVWNIARAWGVRVDYSHEDRKTIYTHHSVGSGLTFKF